MMRRRALALFVVVPAAAGAGVWLADSSDGPARPRPRDPAGSDPPAVDADAAADAAHDAPDVVPGPLEPDARGLVPVPVEAFGARDHAWTLPPDVRVRATAEAGRAVAELLAADLRTATGRPVPVVVGAAGEGTEIRLILDPTGLDRAGGLDGDEAYEVTVTERGATIRAGAPVGLYRGAQTLRQLVPVKAPFVLRGGSVRDAPRYPYRGIMIDLARHFYRPAEMRRMIDHIAAYKFNHLHLHLTDDQGWRLAIEGWPRLTGIGAATQVGGTPGGFWSADDYRGVIAYAAERFITVVPEIDMPGHTNAAIVAYPELACDGKPHTPYFGTQVGFSSLCVDGEPTYAFLDDVLGRVAALTPGPYLHIGGDEALTLKPAQYKAFMARAQPLVAKHGKRLVAWYQLADAEPAPGAILEYWQSGKRDAAVVAAAARKGARIVMAPADHVYLDMKYAKGEKLGVNWAGTVDVRKSYEWEPSTHLPGVPADAVIGVEGALWGDTVRSVADAEYLMFPRIAAVAEAAWSRPERRGWTDFRTRVGTHEARWAAAGINYASRL
ncbi:beta-N-acetylhexosaminidase [Embleya sp. NBC_00896]|uniref:beta-N-acetylhexosaminidase n=1 Tax=Embleya sp. NBC_00896 TaxID=2975961 RepID=UPI0038698021|nr:beta-N-acetylhexosaminidase [Embleya sp. NBC_00896]